MTTTQQLNLLENRNERATTRLTEWSDMEKRMAEMAEVASKAFRLDIVMQFCEQ